MNRKRNQIKLIENAKNRNQTYKKRRIGLLRKAMELSMLTGSLIEMKIYNPYDLHLIEYNSSNKDEFQNIKKGDKNVVKNYHQFYNKDMD